VRTRFGWSTEKSVFVDVEKAQEFFELICADVGGSTWSTIQYCTGLVVFERRSRSRSLSPKAAEHPAFRGLAIGY
jgi:hypothetical protein